MESKTLQLAHVRASCLTGLRHREGKKNLADLSDPSQKDVSAEPSRRQSIAWLVALACSRPVVALEHPRIPAAPLTYMAHRPPKIHPSPTHGGGESS